MWSQWLRHNDIALWRTYHPVVTKTEEGSWDVIQTSIISQPSFQWEKTIRGRDWNQKKRRIYRVENCHIKEFWIGSIKRGLPICPQVVDSSLSWILQSLKSHPKIYSATAGITWSRQLSPVIMSLSAPYPVSLTVLTGASGVLGSAIYKALKKANHSVVGLSYTKKAEGLLQLDLTDSNAVQFLIQYQRPDCGFPWNLCNLSDISVLTRFNFQGSFTVRRNDAPT